VPNALARGAGKVKREYSKARSLAAQGRFEEAIEEYRRGREEEPNNLTLRLDIAEIYGSEMKDYPQAIQELEECLKFKPGPAQGASILNRIADIYENNLANTRGARGALQRIQDLYPGTKQALQAGDRVAAMEESQPGSE
jgi:tetratricopeptide (TPR) repeat protein